MSSMTDLQSSGGISPRKEYSLLKALRELEQGNLSYRLSGASDEITHSFNAVASRLEQLASFATSGALDLQNNLLHTSHPTIPGLHIATRYISSHHQETRGDFYDAFPLEGSGRWELVMGDVRGQGSEAAELAALARYSIRTTADIKTPPPEVFDFLNKALLDQDQDSVCSAVIAEIEPRGDDTLVHFSLAGHPRPLLLRADQPVRPVGRHGILLGSSPNSEYIDDALGLRAGDTLLLYTDGVFRSRLDEELLDEAALADLMGNCPSRYPEAVLNYLLKYVEIDGDDIALMAVQVAVKPDFKASFDPQPSLITELRNMMERFADRFSTEEMYNLKVMISEMTTNAIRHGARRPEDNFCLSWWEEEDFLRILIENPGPAFIPEPQIGHDTPGGRGIWLVSELADRWGVTCHNAEVQVWAEKHWKK